MRCTRNESARSRGVNQCDVTGKSAADVARGAAGARCVGRIQRDARERISALTRNESARSHEMNRRARAGESAHQARGEHRASRLAARSHSRESCADAREPSRQVNASAEEFIRQLGTYRASCSTPRATKDACGELACSGRARRSRRGPNQPKKCLRRAEPDRGGTGWIGVCAVGVGRVLSCSVAWPSSRVANHSAHGSGVASRGLGVARHGCQARLGSASRGLAVAGEWGAVEKLGRGGDAGLGGLYASAL